MTTRKVLSLVILVLLMVPFLLPGQTHRLFDTIASAVCNEEAEIKKAIDEAMDDILTDLRNRITELESEYESRKSEIEELKKSVEDKSEIIKKYENTIKTLQEQVGNLQGQSD